MQAVEAAPVLGVQQPYPGLRPFELEEALQFYGREAHTAELLRRLSENRFLGVVGSSGSGKSSLVRAGLLPALYRGRLIGATSQWRICVMRPGEAPMANLATVLAEQNVFSSDRDAVYKEITRSSLGLVRAVRASGFVEGESLLLIVDQFEELFRFVHERREEDGGAEARLFVSSLLEAADVFTAPVYVVLTMRSDFLGDCTQFPGLPEALNRSQYLIPRLSREQVRDAIEKPLRLVGASMNPRLVERLLNELGDDMGQLPVLQHALNRTFHEYGKSGRGDEISIDHYLAAGAMDGALDAHADALLESLSEAARPWTEKLFRCLTSVEGGRKVRRPTRLDRIYEIVNARDEASRKAVQEVIEAFSHRDHSLLVWSGKRMTGASVVDISHESLIAHWAKLKLWTEAEEKAAGWYQSASDDAKRNREREAGTWRDPELALALSFIQQGTWNAAWADRLRSCAATFPEVREFLERGAEEQRKEQEAEEARRGKELADAQALADAERQARELADARLAAQSRARYWLIAAAVLFLIAAVAAAASAWSRQQEVAALQKASDAEKRAADLRHELDDKLKSKDAEENSIRAELQKANGQTRQDLEKKLDAIVKDKAEIEKQRVAAEGKASSQQTDLAAALSQIASLTQSLKNAQTDGKKAQDGEASQRSSTDKTISDLKAKNDDLEKKLRAAQTQAATASSPATLAGALDRVGDYYYDHARFKDAEAAYKEELPLQRQLAKDNSTVNLADLAGTLHSLGRVYDSTQRLKEAEGLYLEALAIRRNLAKDNPEFNISVSRTLNNLGLIYLETQRAKEAEAALTEALTLKRQLVKGNPLYLEDVASTLNNIGNVFQKTQRPKEAEVAYTEAIGIYRDLLKANPSGTTVGLNRTLNNLSKLYTATGRPKEAEAARAEAAAHEKQAPK